MEDLSNRRAKDVIVPLKKRISYGDLSGIQTNPDWEIFRGWDESHGGVRQCYMINNKIKGLVRITVTMIQESTWYPRTRTRTTVKIQIHDICLFNNNVVFDVQWLFPDTSVVDIFHKILKDWNACKMEHLL